MTKKNRKKNKKQQNGVDGDGGGGKNMVQSIDANSSSHTTNTKRKNNNKNKAPQTPPIINPLWTAQHAFLTQHMTSTERYGFFSSTIVSPERRAKLWMDQADVGEELVNRYAWATPTDAALKVLHHFSPLVEMGCGSNAYWARQLMEWTKRNDKQQHPIDIVAYDVNVQEGGKIHTGNGLTTKGNDSATAVDMSGLIVRQGGPDVLSDPDEVESNRTLFLCYPDDEDVADDDDNSSEIRSFGWHCLDHYTGEYVIHVGELGLLDANLSLEQAPWGRSTSAEFQQRLASEFHCLLKMQLPSWVHVRDTLSVWKRSELCTMVFAAEDEEGEDDEEVHYRHIPPEEMLPVNVAAPCLAHLLPTTLSSTTKVPPPTAAPETSTTDAAPESPMTTDIPTRPPVDKSGANDNGKQRNRKDGHNNHHKKGKRKRAPGEDVYGEDESIIPETINGKGRHSEYESPW